VGWWRKRRGGRFSVIMRSGFSVNKGRCRW
jgi:hypothetical protein